MYIQVSFLAACRFDRKSKQSPNQARFIWRKMTRTLSGSNIIIQTWFGLGYIPSCGCTCIQLGTYLSNKANLT